MEVAGFLKTHLDKLKENIGEHHANQILTQKNYNSIKLVEEIVTLQSRMKNPLLLEINKNESFSALGNTSKDKESPLFKGGTRSPSQKSFSRVRSFGLNMLKAKKPTFNNLYKIN